MKAKVAAITRNGHLWVPEYLRACVRRMSSRAPRRAWLLLADHFEPYWKNTDPRRAAERVDRWMEQWPRIAGAHRDAGGRLPRYTFFYPEEEYDPGLIDTLAVLAAERIADVEVHLHHDGEGAANFVDRLSRFVAALVGRHGLLRHHDGRPVFAFIHGNWALDNARPDGRWCGLDNEITLLRDLGCYADFTLPCVPEPAQAGPVNSVYWAIDDPARPRSHEDGVPVRIGSSQGGDLLVVPGPLAISWRSGRLWPRIEVGELSASARPTAARADLWLDRSPQLGEDVFIKLHAHGAQERNADALLGGDLDRTLSELEAACARRGVDLYFATAWEMYGAIGAVRQGRDPVATLLGAATES